jgi:hypothetical protein
LSFLANFFFLSFIGFLNIVSWVFYFNCSFCFYCVCVCVCVWEKVNPSFVCCGLSQPQKKGLHISSEHLLVILIMVFLLIVFLLLHIIVLTIVISLNSSFWFDCVPYNFMKHNFIDILIRCKLERSSSNLLKAILM